jgi:hypothetical protein
MAFMKKILLSILHIVAGAACAAGLAYAGVPGISPVLGAVIGSAASSLGSAFCTPPHKVGG